jgi:hypothetical protein
MEQLQQGEGGIWIMNEELGGSKSIFPKRQERGGLQSMRIMGDRRLFPPHSPGCLVSEIREHVDIGLAGVDCGDDGPWGHPI